MLWEYYRRAKTVDLISEYAQIYKHYGRINLEGNAFPLPIRSDHSYRSTFGAGRSFGGRRIHEGTDIFAGYGVPVRSTCYGIIETKVGTALVDGALVFATFITITIITLI